MCDMAKIMTLHPPRCQGVESGKRDMAVQTGVGLTMKPSLQDAGPDSESDPWACLPCPLTEGTSAGSHTGQIVLAATSRSKSIHEAGVPHEGSRRNRTSGSFRAWGLPMEAWWPKAALPAFAQTPR